MSWHRFEQYDVIHTALQHAVKHLTVCSSTSWYLTVYCGIGCRLHFVASRSIHQLSDITTLISTIDSKNTLKETYVYAKRANTRLEDLLQMNM